MGYLFIAIFLMVYGQVALKWRMNNLGVVLKDGLADKVVQLLKLTLDPFILTSFIAAFASSLFWMAALSKMELTRAYPFLSLSPALVFLVGVLFLNEEFSLGKLLGIIIIGLGVFVTVKF